MKKLVIFDLDGTLIDTIVDAGRCFNKVLEYFGLKTYPLEEYKHMVGGNLEVIFSNLVQEKDRTDEMLLKLKEKYREVYLADSKPNTKPFAGILDVLKKLNEDKNLSIAINTNKSQLLAEELCANMFTGINFAGILGYIESRPSKPDPYAANELMRLNGALPQETIYVGDSITDITTAKNAGIDCILVNWLSADVTGLVEENNVKFVANIPADIFKFL